jgi:peptidoglycan/xylan/chitin deacetylase (PgdA/CDA1 family)
VSRPSLSTPLLRAQTIQRLGAGWTAGLLVSTLVVTGLSRVHPSTGVWTAVAAAFAGGWAIAVRSPPLASSSAARLLLSAALIGGATLAARFASYPVGLLCAAAVCGLVLATVLPRCGIRPRIPLGSWPATAIGITIGSLLATTAPPVAAAIAGGTGGGLAAVAVGPSPPCRRCWIGLVPALAVAGSLALIGATNPAAQWLGPVVSHGPRDANRVALTFDDGPNGDATRRILDVLDERGVKATFFVVGKAVEAEPATVQRIVADGHLLGNHSHSHDGWRFIQPGYPELQQGERDIVLATGVCPRYYRPPHGTHTPFVWLAARQRSMRVVTWDVSAADWDATDAAGLARKIVAQSHPGSIVLLHDGIDGIAGADREVVVQALPAILDGLRARGLEPVRLDRLLDESGERPC